MSFILGNRCGAFVAKADAKKAAEAQCGPLYTAEVSEAIRFRSEAEAAAYALSKGIRGFIPFEGPRKSGRKKI
jgi:hypothetical protein